MYVFVKKIQYRIKMNASNNALKTFLISKTYVAIKIVLAVDLHIRLNVPHAKQIIFYMTDNVVFLIQK